MSKKFFTLIHGDNIHVAPKKKIIPAEDFSQLLSAEHMLEQVKKDADKYVQETVQECEKMKEAAQKEGFEEGFKQWGELIAKLELEISNVRKEIEKVIVPVALKAAKKIVGREIEVSSAIVDIVSNNLKAVSQHKKIKIYVNKSDLEVLEAQKGQLKQIFEGLESLSVIERNDIKPGGCVIETEGGIINAQLENQWRILEQAFESLAKQKAISG